MKKVFTLLLLLGGFIGTANAWTNIWLVSDGNLWGADPNNNNEYNASTMICVDDWKFHKSNDGNEFVFVLDGSVINSGDFYFRFYVHDNLGNGHHEVGPTNFTDNVNHDQVVSTTRVTTNNFDNIQTKSFKIQKNANAKKVNICIKYDNDVKWCVSAAAIEDEYTITYDKETSGWSNCYCYAYVGDCVLNKAWPGTEMTSTTGTVYTCTITSNASVLIFDNNSGIQTGNITEIIKNGCYKSTGISGVTASITSVGFATFSSTKALNFSGETTIEACKASVAPGGHITYTTVTSVAANEGVLLRRKDGDIATASSVISLNADQTISANTGNDFVGITTKQLVNQTGNSKTNYILTNQTTSGSGPLGFYKVNRDGSYCAAGTAYLATSESPASARGYFPVWDESTSVESLETNITGVNQPVFDLQGRRVTIPQKGLYIVNGKKVIK